MMDYHGDQPQSFGGRNIAYQYVNKKEVDKTLDHSDIYTRFKQHKKPRKFSPIYVNRKRELFQSDVVFFTNKDMVKANDGYKYSFTTVDVFKKWLGSTH